MEQTKSVPEILGFLGTDESRREFRQREEPYSQITYQAMYLLYEYEAEDVLRESVSHAAVNQTLTLRFNQNRDYRNRVYGYSDDPEIRAEYGIEEGNPATCGIGGYALMQQVMEDAGVIPPEEKAAVETLNRLFGDDR